MKRLLLFLACLWPLSAQTYVRWAATTGDVSLSSAGTTVTIQQPATNANQTQLETAWIYCSVACSITQAANGAAATATAGTITPILPNQLNTAITTTFWTGSNVGSGTAQGGIIHIPAGGLTQTICLSTVCGASATVSLGTGGTGNNYSFTIASLTGTVNITIIGRSAQ